MRVENEKLGDAADTRRPAAFQNEPGRPMGACSAQRDRMWHGPTAGTARGVNGGIQVSDSKYSGRAVSLLVLAALALTGQRAQENVVPLKNWATPLYWQPNQAETTASEKPLPQLQFSANAVSTNALTFVAITPCRLVDTRGAAAGFNGIDPFSGPSIAAKATLTIPVQSATEATSDTEPAPCGVIPSIAQAYSFNLTVVPHGGGRGRLCVAVAGRRHAAFRRDLKRSARCDRGQRGHCSGRATPARAMAGSACITTVPRPRMSSST